ncbi:MAG: hypothetical protein EZS28_053642, partial [Streblomastix strix]
MTMSNPGPIDNNPLLCKHKRTLPPSQRVVAISPLLYFECVRAFGGGPTVRYPSKRCQKCD